MKVLVRRENLHGTGLNLRGITVKVLFPVNTFTKTFTSWVAELAVEYSVSDIGELTIFVEEWKRDRRLGVIWKP